MTPQNVLDLTRDALLLVFWVTLPIVAVAAISALSVSIVQAVTQIQDQSIGQSIRIIAVMLTIVLLASVLGRNVWQFAERALQTLVQLS
jgi:type III secretion protein S